MDFWGLFVQDGRPQKVTVKPGYLVHLSLVSLEGTSEPKQSVLVQLTCNDRKYLVARLNQSTSQLACDLVFTKDFSISHNWKGGVVSLIGYVGLVGEQVYVSDSSDEKVKDVQIAEDGQLAAPNAKPSAIEPKEVMPKTEEKEDNDSESDEVNSSKKRPNADAQTPQSKAAKKLVTPQKSDAKKGVATPDSTNKSGNSPAGDKTPKPSSGGFVCRSCNKTFKSDSNLQNHCTDKHGAQWKMKRN